MTNRLEQIKENNDWAYHEKGLGEDIDWLISAVESAKDVCFGVCLLDLQPKERELIEKLKERLEL